jgi:L-aminopeptidase/D-esterase-like protein
MGLAKQSGSSQEAVNESAGEVPKEVVREAVIKVVSEAVNKAVCEAVSDAVVRRANVKYASERSNFRRENLHLVKSETLNR